MTQYRVKLPITLETYQRLAEINRQLDQHSSDSIAHPLAETCTTITREVLQQVFRVLVEKQLHSADTHDQAKDTLEVLDFIDEQIAKYMPWSISVLGNQRLKPVARYIFSCFESAGSSQDQLGVLEEHQLPQQSTSQRLTYSLEPKLAIRLLQHFLAVEQGDLSVKDAMFRDLIQVIDAGVDSLIKHPKSLLKFNFVINKTLDGVINTITSRGYKRIEKIGHYMSPDQAQEYAQHFRQFLD